MILRLKGENHAHYVFLTPTTLTACHYSENDACILKFISFFYDDEDDDDEPPAGSLN